MRYSFQLLNSTGDKVDEFIKLEARLSSGWRLVNGQTLIVTDNMNTTPTFMLYSHDQIEAWMQDLAVAESRMREAANCSVTPHVPWNPFKEHEWLSMAGEGKISNPSDKLSYKGDVNVAAEVSAKAKAALVDSNLKTAAAVGKPQVSGVPPIAIMALGAAMQDGVNKYGKFNWRGTGVTSSVFYDAIHRHLAAWYSGQNYTTDSNVHELAAIMASCAILMDAELHGVMNDDRDLKGHKVTLEEQSFYKVA